jgi:ELWxxDGT repeat protein
MRRKLSVALFAAALGCSTVASGLGLPYRVADLNQARPQHADRVGFVGELSGRAIVLKVGYRDDADGKEHPQAELWASDPATGRAEPIAGFVLDASYPELLGEVRGRLLFRLNGYSPVWTTDGTRAGTTPISPAFQSPFDNAVGWYFRIGDRMILSDLQGMAWSTDGTAAGTEPLAVPFPWAHTGGDPLPTLGSRAYFLAGRRVIGSDGTAAGTSTLVEFHDGEVDGLVATTDRLYFVRGTPPTQELWMSDGSAEGTRRVRRFGPRYGATRIELPMRLAHGIVFLECPLDGSRCHLAQEGTGSSGPSRLTPDLLVPFPLPVVLHTGASGVLFADGDGQLWRTDGTRKGTAALGRCAGECRSQEDGPFPIARSGGRSLFSALAPAATAYSEWQVWVTDGTDAGTRPLDARCASRPGCGTQLAAVNGDVALLEVTDTFPQRRRVARLDVPGLRPVAALGEGTAIASGDGFLVVGDLLTRLSADGSVLASMGYPGQRDGDAEPRSLIALGDRLVFTACDGERQRIYWTDGTPGATVPLADGPEDCWTYGPPVPPVSLGGAVVVDTRHSMIRVDAAGHAVSILDSRAAAMVPMGDALTLLVPSWECDEDSDDCLFGTWLTEVFVSPGGAAPASQVATLRIAPVREHLALGDRLLIADPATAEGLFAFRPSQAGAGLRAIRCPAAGHVCPPGELARLGDVAFLLADAVLWRIEGNAGTRIAPPVGAPELYVRSGVVGFDGTLYFLAQPQDDGRTWLYRSDGSGSGIVALAPIGEFYGPIDFQPLGLDGKLYFTAATPELGEELWVSDGTAAGTHLFLDLREGAAGSGPLLLSVAAGRLFFAADDGEHGVELWSTDGVAAHTAMVADIAPGPLSAWPGRPVLVGGTLYFAAQDGIAGSELWAVPVAP